LKLKGRASTDFDLGKETVSRPNCLMTCNVHRGRCWWQMVLLTTMLLAWSLGGKGGWWDDRKYK
ncbi:hypothetical protein BgiBS90_013158, partial [Biomphalaria glabrata]